MTVTWPGADLDALAAAVVEHTVTLARIPAPTGEEAARAEVVAAWWRDAGCTEVHTDDVGNCWATARPGTGPAVVVAAHLDTVFGRDTAHDARREGSRLVGPSVGDDSVAVASLGAVARLLRWGDGGAPVLLLATVGEEGLGNLRGAQHAVTHPPLDIGAFIAVEGNYLGRVGRVGVGSRRWDVRVAGPGGHAWERSQAPSAVHEAARLISALGALPTRPGLTSLNVGCMRGGEAVNARAAAAAFRLEIRAADGAELRSLGEKVASLLHPQHEALSVDAADIGQRPSGSLGSDHPLARAARSALEARGLPVADVATSTDANAAHAAGIPAVALGVTTGAGEHTPEEWIDLPPIADGVAVLADTIRRCDAAGAARTTGDRGGTGR